MRGKLRAAVVGVGLVLASVPAGAAAREYRDGAVRATVTPDRVALANRQFERSWTLAPFGAERLVDLRGEDRVWSGAGPEFAVDVAGVELSSESFAAEEVRVRRLRRGGLRAEFTLRADALPGLEVTRAVEAYPGVAGLRAETSLSSRSPLALSGASLAEHAVGPAAPTAHAFRAGADWREPEWEGPALSVGDPHAGTWRESTSGERGESLEGAGQWLSVNEAGRRMFMVAEANDFPSVRVGYDGDVAAVRLDYSRDVLSLGPFEEQAHIEGLVPGAGRVRTVRPGTTLELPAVFTGLARGPADEPWQFHRYLTEHRLRPYRHAVTFNSNGTDADRISTGAKDDMDIATVREVAPIARRLGVETFILDDGWQARSGDWKPDSPEYPEPRWDGDPGSKFAPRFPDPEFAAVREAIAPMRLGLWMSPTFFNPTAETYTGHPEWACQPLAGPLVAQNQADPDSGSNEAGLGPWSPDALPHIEARIREAIEEWGVVYFKFDFLVWLDCMRSEGGFSDLYEFHDEFVAMLDHLRRDYPRVSLQIDETNDYRLFPFESISRGPTWFQNGTPPLERMLHNLWNLSPYVPSFALGQNALADEEFGRYPVDTLMAGALLSHITFFSDLRELPERVVRRARAWVELYRRRRSLLDGVVYPLLDDPLADGWTALQAWNPRRGEGALLAFRQGAADEERRIALGNVPRGRRFELLEAPNERPVGTMSSRELRAGLPVEIPRPDGARVLLIRPADRSA